MSKIKFWCDALASAKWWGQISNAAIDVVETIVLQKAQNRIKIEALIAHFLATKWRTRDCSRRRRRRRRWCMGGEMTRRRAWAVPESGQWWRWCRPRRRDNGPRRRRRSSSRSAPRWRGTLRRRRRRFPSGARFSGTPSAPRWRREASPELPISASASGRTSSIATRYFTIFDFPLCSIRKLFFSPDFYGDFGIRFLFVNEMKPNQRNLLRPFLWWFSELDFYVWQFQNQIPVVNINFMLSFWGTLSLLNVWPFGFLHL